MSSYIVFYGIAFAAADVIGGGADYVSALKGNRETLHGAVIAHVNERMESDFAKILARRHVTQEQGMVKRSGIMFTRRSPRRRAHAGEDRPLDASRAAQFHRSHRCRRTVRPQEPGSDWRPSTESSAERRAHQRLEPARRGNHIRDPFPCAATASDVPPPHGIFSASRGSETILLVEDKSEIRALVRKMLELQGYRVLEAEDVQAALALGKQHAAEIKLLLTDVVMPRKSGRQVAELLAAEIPGLAIAYMSGYAGDVLMERGILPRNVTVLQKPFGARQLLAAVRNALGAVCETNGDPCN